jgi:hypothetical protein
MEKGLIGYLYLPADPLMAIPEISACHIPLAHPKHPALNSENDRPTRLWRVFGEWLRPTARQALAPQEHALSAAQKVILLKAEKT